MDELKVKLNTKFVKNMVAKFIRKTIFKKSGHDVTVELQELSVEMKGDKVYLHTTVDANISTEEFMKLMKRML